MNTNRPQRSARTPQKRARVGERIKLSATSAGLTLKELASRVGCAPSLMYQYVRGITNIPDDTLAAIARTTGVVLDFFDPDKDPRVALAMPGEAPENDRPAVGVSADRVSTDLKHLQKLAEAYEEPGRNVQALLSTLHEMLALARVRTDRPQEAYVLWRIGTVHREAGNYDDAQRHLAEAEKLFAAENLESYRIVARLDLGSTMGEAGLTESAVSVIESVAASDEKDLRWRALMNLGTMYYRVHRLDDALRAFTRAAEAMEDIDAEQRESVGIPHLISNVADVAMDAGHHEAALALWTRTLAQAAEERSADVFVEALLNTAQACQAVGKISEARQRLEQAVMLASFMFTDQNRIGLARALLADVMVALGALDQARDEARSALKSATKGGAPRGMILASLALAETCLASGQLDESLSYAHEAVRMAERAKRPREEVLARNVRARVALQMGHRNGDAETMRKALEEARAAVALAEKIGARREELVARVTVAQCLWRSGLEGDAEEEAAKAVDLTRQGAVGLARLIGEDAEHLPEILRRAPLDLPNLFSGRGLTIPAVEWQAHYLQGTLRAKRLGPEAAFVAMRDAATALSRLLAGLTPDDALSFSKLHPQIASVYEDLSRCALTDADRNEARALLEGARVFAGAGEGGQARLPSRPA